MVFDIIDGEGSIEDLGTEVDGANANVICPTTPCVVDLAIGEHRLALHQGGRDDEVSLTVGATPRAHRRAMSYDSGAHDEYLALAATGLVLGGGSSPVFGAIASIDTENMRGADAGLILGGVISGALIVTGIVGVVLMILEPREVRDGLSFEWDLVP